MTLIRKKGVSPWIRVWEVLCPDCRELRSVKDRPKRGIMVARCASCACKRAFFARSRAGRKWKWLDQDRHAKQWSPFLRVCVTCGLPEIVDKGNLIRGFPLWGQGWRCRHCALSHSRKCNPATVQKTYFNLKARANGTVGKHSFVVTRCALCAAVNVRDRQTNRRLYCRPCAGVHNSVCEERYKAPAGFVTVKELATLTGRTRSASYRLAHNLGIEAEDRAGKRRFLIKPP